MPTRSTSTWLDDQRKDHLYPKRPKQRKRPKQQQTHNVLTDVVEIINSINKRRVLLLANKPRIVPWGTERMSQRIRRHSRVIFHRSAHPKREQNQTEKYSYRLDWLQNGIWYGSAKLDNKLSQNVQNVRWCLKLYRENHENLVVELISGKINNHAWDITSQRRRCLTICLKNGGRKKTRQYWTQR